MIIKKNKNLDFFLNKNISLILYFFFFIIIFLFFLKSFNYSFFWFKYFKASLNGLINEKIFWDFEVYKCAANKLINDQNPYTLLTECMPSKKPFIHNYPILSTFLFIPFTLINFFWSKVVWGLFLLIFFIFYIIYQRKLFSSNIHYLFYSFIILFCLDKAVVYSFITGNISFILQILLACSFYFLYKKKINTFFVIIFLISCFKFYFLIFAVCPILLWKLKYKKEVLLTSAALFIFYLANYLYDPNLFNNWIQNIYKVSVGKNYYDSFGIGSLKCIISINNFLESHNIIKFNNREYFEVLFTFLYLVFIIGLGFCYLNTKNIVNEKNFKTRIAFSILIVAISIPRLEVYELIIFVAPIIFLIENFYDFRNIKKKIIIFLCFLFISIFLLNGDSSITYPFLVIFTFISLFIFQSKKYINLS